MDSPFFTLHRGLPREGPGDAESLDWALGVAAPAPDGWVLDAGCGPGADIPGLLQHVPDGRILGLDLHAPFVEAARARLGGDPRVTLRAGDMARPEGRFDLIWCAGALYFLGLEPGLAGWRAALRPGGRVAFSHPVFFVAEPSPGARAFWQGDPVSDIAQLRAEVAAAGYEILATRPLPDAAWEAFYTPMDARIAALRSGAPAAALAAVLDAGEAEAAGWRAHAAETGYLQVVARPA
ncbi:MAG: class I SAM-dependent methyltransferase [Pseudomonadota bacterium]